MNFSKAITALLFALTSASVLQASSYSCVNTSADVTNIRNLVASGGTLTITGTCNFASGQVAIGNAIDIEGGGRFNIVTKTYTGGAVINGPGQNTASNTAFTVNVSSGVTLNGLTVNNGLGLVTINPNKVSITITNNLIENTRSNAGGIFFSGVSSVTTIANNEFYDIGPDDLLAWPSNPCSISVSTGYYWSSCSLATNTGPPNGKGTNCASNSACDATGGVGITISNGMDQTQILNNFFNYMAKDSIYINSIWLGADNFWGTTPATNNRISYNQMFNQHRYGFEFQGNQAYANGCPSPAGGNTCDYNRVWMTNTLINGNTFYAPYFVYSVYCYSLALSSIYNGQVANNSCVNPFSTSLEANYQNGSVNQFIEDSGLNVLTQGNVATGNSYPGYPNPNAIGGGIVYGYNALSPSGTRGLYTTQNNVECGLGYPGTNANFGTENNPPGLYANALNQYNDFIAGSPTVGASCPGSPNYPSGITPVYKSSSTSGATTTFNFGVTSNYAVIGVSYAVDGTTIGLQEISDVNTNFATTPQFLYHVSLNPAAYSAGGHTLTMTATDGIQGTAVASTTFSGGGATAPSVTFSPANLAFGSVSSTLSTTLKNSGSASLSISGIAITGTNAGSYSQTNTCPASLAVAATCTISITFAGGSGSLVAAISVTTNASGSPQTVPLSGGTAVVFASPGSLTFPSTTVGATTAAQTVTLNNNSGASITVTSGTTSAPFSVSGTTCGSTLANGATCTYSLVYSPTNAGTQTGSLSIADSSPTSPHAVGLSGSAPTPASVTPGTYTIAGGSYCFDDGAYYYTTVTTAEIYTCNSTVYQNFSLTASGSYFKICAVQAPSTGYACLSDPNTGGNTNPLYNVSQSPESDLWTVLSNGVIQNVYSSRYLANAATPANNALLLMSSSSFNWTLTLQSASTVFAFTSAVPPIASIGQTVTVSWNTTAVATLTGAGTCTGCGTPVTSITYTAPSSIETQQIALGCPVGPNDSVFNTRGDALPANANDATWRAAMTPAPINFLPSWGTIYATSTTPLQSWIPYYGNGQANFSNAYPFPWVGRTSSWLKRENGAYNGVTGFANTPDHHAITVRTSDCTFYETYDDRQNLETFACAVGAGTNCNVNSIDYYGWTNATMTGWTGGPYAMPFTATDAGGLPIEPLTLRLQDIKQGSINHAGRMTLNQTMNGFVWPATNSNRSVANAPPYGARMVMKTQANGGPNHTTVCGSNADCLTIMTWLQNWGLFVADIGINGQITTDTDVAEDPLTRAALLLINAANITDTTNFTFQNEASLQETSANGWYQFQNGSYSVDPSNGHEDAATYATLTVTPTGGSAVKMPIALQGTAIGMKSSEMAIAAGMGPYQLLWWVNPSTASQTVNWTKTSSTCSGDSVTSGGVYTPPSTGPCSATLVGTAAADSATPYYLTVQVLSVDTDGGIRIDTGATSPTTDTTTATNVWNADADLEGSGGGWTCTPNDYPTSWGAPYAAQFDSLCYGGNDLRYILTVPNGNYDVSFLQGQTLGNPPAAGTIAAGLQFQSSPNFYEAQGVSGAHQADWNWSTNNLYGQGWITTIPATVTDNTLQVRVGTMTYDTALTGAMGIGPLYNGASKYFAPPNQKLTYLNGLAVVPDSGAAHLTIDCQGALTVSNSQALQCYAVPWFTSAGTLTWTVNGGPTTTVLGKTGPVTIAVNITGLISIGANAYSGQPFQLTVTNGTYTASVWLKSAGGAFIVN